MTSGKPLLKQMSVFRLNSDLFPVSDFEYEAYRRYAIEPRCVGALDETVLKEVADCDAICVVSEALPAAVIEGLSQCRVISRLGAGTDKIDRQCATRHGIVITNVPDFCVEEQADHTMALLLAVVRKLPQMRSDMLAGRWNDARAACRPLHRLNGRTLGLVGFGLSAKAVARRALGFGLRVIACRGNPRIHDPVAEELGVEMTDLDTVIRVSDYVSLHLPLTDETRGMFNADLFSRMKRDAIFINTARGSLVDEEALAAQLRSGHLAGAGIDTFHGIDVHTADQHQPPQHVLLDLACVVFTPHVAAFSVESSRDVGYGAVENLASVLSGRWPRRQHVVNPDVVPRYALT